MVSYEPQEANFLCNLWKHGRQQFFYISLQWWKRKPVAFQKSNTRQYHCRRDTPFGVRRSEVCVLEGQLRSFLEKCFFSYGCGSKFHAKARFLVEPKGINQNYIKQITNTSDEYDPRIHRPKNEQNQQRNELFVSLLVLLDFYCIFFRNSRV